MRHFYIPLAGLFAFMLVGCPTAQVAQSGGLQPTPLLLEVYSEELPSGVKFLEYSSDGSLLVAASGYRFAALYSADDYSPLEKYDEPDSSSIHGAGFIDTNTWYYAIDNNENRKQLVHIRTIQPAQEVFSYAIHDYGDDKTFVNSAYIANGNYLYNWHTKRIYRFMPADVRITGYRLTPSNRVLTTSWPGAKNPFIQIDDPVNGKVERWETSLLNFAMTPDERFAIQVTGKGACDLWQLPERKVVQHCEQDVNFGSYSTRLSVAPGGATFAFSRDQHIKIYRIEPFQLEQKLEMPGIVSALVLSDDGWLAAMDQNGRLRVWDVTTGTLVGVAQYDQEGITDYLPERTQLAFRPGGRHLAAGVRDHLKILELPSRTGR
jgi:WD40 repeat protein